jgi:hypothetical protein
MSLVISSSVSAGLNNLAIFKTSLISLLPVFHTDDAICITMFGGKFLIVLTDIDSNPNRYFQNCESAEQRFAETFCTI